MLTLPHVVSDTYEYIYLRKLMHFTKYRCLESIQDTFVLTNPNENVVSNPVRKFNPEFSKKFAEWLWSGGKDISELHSSNENAKKFDSEYKGRFSSYGPRITGQLNHIITELENDPFSRRACMLILDERDQIIAEGLRETETKCEYPCTLSLTFFIREGKLHCQTFMRSNNYVLTVCIDVFVFTTFQKYISEILKIPIGSYFHCAANAHIFSHELPFVDSILNNSDLRAELI